MEKDADDLSFEGAWAKQVKEEKEEHSPKARTEVKIHDGPKFRGQRDIVEKRTDATSDYRLENWKRLRAPG